MRVDSRINECHRIEILAECIVEATSNWRRGGGEKRRRVFKQLLNPKAYGTAIYALTRKTRIQRERRILWLVCMYTSWETGFPSSHPFIPGKNNPRNASCNRQPVASLETRETFKHDPDVILSVSNLSSRYYKYQYNIHPHFIHEQA